MFDEVFETFITNHEVEIEGKDYSEIAIFKLLELLDTYLSIAIGQMTNSILIAEKVCEPGFLSAIIRMSVESSS